MAAEETTNGLSLVLFGLAALALYYLGSRDQGAELRVVDIWGIQVSGKSKHLIEPILHQETSLRAGTNVQTAESAGWLLSLDLGEVDEYSGADWLALLSVSSGFGRVTHIGAAQCVWLLKQWSSLGQSYQRSRARPGHRYTAATWACNTFADSVVVIPMAADFFFFSSTMLSRQVPRCKWCVPPAMFCCTTCPCRCSMPPSNPPRASPGKVWSDVVADPLWCVEAPGRYL